MEEGMAVKARYLGVIPAATRISGVSVRAGVAREDTGERRGMKTAAHRFQATSRTARRHDSAPSVPGTGDHGTGTHREFPRTTRQSPAEQRVEKRTSCVPGNRLFATTSCKLVFAARACIRNTTTPDRYSGSPCSRIARRASFPDSIPANNDTPRQKAECTNNVCISFTPDYPCAAVSRILASFHTPCTWKLRECDDGIQTKKYLSWTPFSDAALLARR